jgi:alpha-1,6-mannosyltransferase
MTTPPIAAPATPLARLSPAAVVGHAGLGVLLGSGAWVAVAAAGSARIVDTTSAAEPHWLAGPLAGLAPPLTDASFSALLLLMLAGYVAAVASARALPDRSALVASFALVALFGLAPVILSADLFGYVAYARLPAVHHLNPYVHAPISAPHDPILPFVYWRHATSPYGPLYTLLSIPTGATPLPVAVWSLKSLSTISCLLALGLIARAAPAYGRSPGQATLLVGGNPLLLAYGVGGGHNDLLVLAAAAGAILLLARERRAAHGSAVLALATGLKITGALLLPFALVASRDRRRFALGALAAIAATGALALAAFGTPIAGQVARISAGGQFVAASSGPALLGRLLGTGATGGVRVVLAIAAVLVVAVGLWRVQRGADWLGAAALSGIAALLAVPTLVPWYVAWVAPAAALARPRSARIALLAITGALVLTRLRIAGLPLY